MIHRSDDKMYQRYVMEMLPFLTIENKENFIKEQRVIQRSNKAEMLCRILSLNNKYAHLGNRA